MVSLLDTGLSGLGSIPGQGHCIVFLGKASNSHSASLHPGVSRTPRPTFHPGEEESLYATEN